MYVPIIPGLSIGERYGVSVLPVHHEEGSRALGQNTCTDERRKLKNTNLKKVSVKAFARQLLKIATAAAAAPPPPLPPPPTPPPTPLASPQSVAPLVNVSAWIFVRACLRVGVLLGGRTDERV